MACLCEAENHTFRTRGASGQERVVWDVGGLGAAVDTMLEKPGTKKHERVIHEADIHMQHGRTYEHVATRRVRVQSHVPVFRRLVHVDDGDVIAVHINDGTSVQVSRRDVVLLYRLSRDDRLVQLE